ncbi:MAG: VWA domain-containing protein [bacterium]|nr:VWA domain-containing protein [bacterium]
MDRSRTSPAGRRLLYAWLLSIVVHFGVFVTMFSVPWLAGRGDGVADPTVAETELLDPAEDVHTSLMRLKPTFGKVAPVKPQEVRFAPKEFESSIAVGKPHRRELSVIGLGAGGSDLGKYGLGVGQGDSGPQFFGLGGSARGARRVVYVVDRSGSMLNTFDAVRAELLRSVERLRRSMRFHVIFFSAGPPLENPAKKLVHASRQEKRRLAEFLAAVQPKGGTDPIPAMRKAFAVNPDVIYLLTDGKFEPPLLDALRKWNKRKKVRIFTIAYVDPTGAELLKRIAAEHNGEYRYVSEYELDR